MRHPHGRVPGISREPRDIVAVRDALDACEDGLRRERQSLREIHREWQSLRPDDFDATRIISVQRAIDHTQVEYQGIEREVRSTIDFVRDMLSSFDAERATLQQRVHQLEQERDCHLSALMQTGAGVVFLLVLFAFTMGVWFGAWFY